MSHHLSTALVAVTLAATVGPTRPPSGFSHRGVVVDASTKNPIPDVLAVAATSNKLVEKSDCPKYDGFVGQATSKPDGTFTLHLADTVRAYFVTYCRARYETFTPPEPNENTNDSASIIPAPVRLWPLNGEAPAMRNALALLRDDTRAAVVALHQADPTTFAAAVKLLKEPEQRLVQEWVTSAAAHLPAGAMLAMMRPALAAQQLPAPVPLAEMTAQLRRALASQQLTLSYFKTASPEHFRTQVEYLPDLQRYIDRQAAPPTTYRPPPPPPPPPLPHPDHIVVVIMANKAFDDVIGSPNAPYINKVLVPLGTVLTQSYGMHYPSQPNYFELFAGTYLDACTNMACPAVRSIKESNLATSLISAQKTFVGYAENLPLPLVCGETRAQYTGLHCPWIAFANVPANLTMDFAQFPTDFRTLPTVAFVIPNLFHNMERLDGTTAAAQRAIRESYGTLGQLREIALEVQQGDDWLRGHLDAYARWAAMNNSLLIITWDTDRGKYPVSTTCRNLITTAPPMNHIPTLIVGAHVKTARLGTMRITHHNLLRTILDMEGLQPFAGARTAAPITDIWK